MIVHFYILPNSSENKICGLHNNEVKVKLRAKPIEGEANKAIIDFLSDYLDIPKKQIEIKRGDTSRHKQIEFHIEIEIENKIRKTLGL